MQDLVSQNLFRPAYLRCISNARYTFLGVRHTNGDRRDCPSTQGGGAMPSRRRVVTGHDDNGLSTVVSDGVVEPRTSPGLPGVDMLYLWGTDGPARYPD